MLALNKQTFISNNLTAKFGVDSLALQFYTTNGKNKCVVYKKGTRLRDIPRVKLVRQSLNER